MFNLPKKINFSSKNYSFNGKAPMSKTYAGLIEGTNSAGGYTVPSPLADWFLNQLDKNSWARQLFEVRTMNSKTLTIPRITDGDTVYLGGEGLNMNTEGGLSQASSSYTKPTWSTLTITPVKFNGLSGYSSELEEDSILNIAQITLKELVKGFNWFEEQAFIQGEAGGSKFGWTSGDTRYGFDGLIDKVQGTLASTGNNWTPDSDTNTNWIDGQSQKLTTNMLNQVIAKIEEQRGTCDVMLVSPNVASRLRDKNEFEMLQTVKDIGADRAALIKGFVGRYYTADIFVSHFLPTGVSVFNSSTSDPKDTLMLGLDSKSPVIVDRRKLDLLTRANFYEDVYEMRMTERVGFSAYYDELIAGIADVQSAV